MTPELKETIHTHQWLILGGGCTIFSLIMTILSALKAPVLKLVVLLGTFALAMAFAGNDLVNFVGVPLTSLDAYLDYTTNGNGNPNSFLMTSLMESAHTPVIYLIIAGIVMVLSLVFSQKAQNVVNTSVALSRQDEGDEMFGSSALARVIVRQAQKIASFFSEYIPKPVARWIDSRFNQEAAVLPDGAAFEVLNPQSCATNPSACVMRIDAEVVPYEEVVELRSQIEQVQRLLDDYQKQIINTIQQHSTKIQSATVFLSLIQESQILLSNLRHILRGISKFTA